MFVFNLNFDSSSKFDFRITYQFQVRCLFSICISNWIPSLILDLTSKSNSDLIFKLYLNSNCGVRVRLYFATGFVFVFVFSIDFNSAFWCSSFSSHFNSELCFPLACQTQFRLRFWIWIQSPTPNLIFNLYLKYYYDVGVRVEFAI